MIGSLAVDSEKGRHRQVMEPLAIERAAFYRERAAGMYSPFPYSTSQGAREIPYILFQVRLAVLPREKVPFPI